MTRSRFTPFVYEKMSLLLHLTNFFSKSLIVDVFVS